MNYRQALDALEERQEQRIELGLDRVISHLAGLGNPHLDVPIIHVAGTNAKGSVCVLLANVLVRAGYRTGLYTSPHLLDVRERIQINGEWISKKSFARLMEKSLMCEKGFHLTYFEVLTSIAFQYFADSKADVAILETGLGGRLDATNVVGRPLVTILTTVDYDHMNHLGTSLSQIAFEKAGILKREVPCLCGVSQDEALEVIQRRARELKVSLMLNSLGDGVRVGPVNWLKNFQILNVPGIGPVTLGLLGKKQARNAALVLVAVEILKEKGWKVPLQAVKQGYKTVKWPGRFQVLRFKSNGKQRTLVLDGAHNPEAMRNFAATLAISPWRNGPKVFILGMLRDKNRMAMLQEVAPYLEGSRVIVTAPDSPRSHPPERLADEVARSAHADVEVLPSAPAALERWCRDPGLPDTAFLCGSFYLVGSALKWLGARE